MRCLALADAISKEGGLCYFVCREHPGHLIDMIRDHGHQVIALPLPDLITASPIEALDDYAGWLGSDWTSDAQQTIEVIQNISVDLLVVDHYALDSRWEKIVGTNCGKLMVIDDLANRFHDCDILLDQTFGRSSMDYKYLVPFKCLLVCGSKYALLRPEFAALRQYSLRRRREFIGLHDVLIAMGGVDGQNATGKILDALQICSLPSSCRITVVLGTTAPWILEVRSQAELMRWPTRVLIGASNMAELMANSDLSIGAAGSTSWERCSLGLPTIMLALADNQLKISHHLSSAGASLMVDYLNLKESLFSAFEKLDSKLLRKMSAASAAITDGKGVLEVIARINEEINNAN